MKQSFITGASAAVFCFCVACASSTPAPTAAEPSSATESVGTQPVEAQSTEPAEGTDPATRSASVFVVHQVPDYDAYLEQFRGNREERKKAGVTRVILARFADDPQRVALHFSATSLKAIQTFLAGTEYQKLLDADQATNSSLVWIVTDELNELPSEVPSASASLFKKFPLSDPDCAVQKLSAAQAVLQSQGVLGYSLHQTTGEAPVAVLHLLATSRESAEQAFQSDSVFGLLTACGATGLEKPHLAENQIDEFEVQ